MTAEALPRRSLISRVFRGALTGALVLTMITCGLIVLAIAGLETGGVAFGLALCLAILPVPVYLALVLWVDRFEPEPLRMIVLTFAWGATIACFVAILLNTIGEVIVAEELGTEAAEVYGSSFSAPIVEELAKAAVLFGIYWWKRDEFNGIIDGIVYAALVGLGFAMTENVLYYGRGAVEEGVVGAVGTFVVRGLMSPFAHPLFTAMTGIGLGVAAASGSRGVRVAAPLVGLVAAILLHSAWNTSAGTGLFFGVYVLIMLPMLALLGVIVLVGLRREARTIRTHLRGVLPDDEVATLASLGARRRERTAARRTGGRGAARAVRERQRTATELAFHRAQTERGALRRNRLMQARESALLAQLQRTRRLTA
jgi:RsiW-degrading membrane proteinase PrsW (M82 family)